jgi:hypothetical protein
MNAIFSCNIDCALNQPHRADEALFYEPFA